MQLRHLPLLAAVILALGACATARDPAVAAPPAYAPPALVGTWMVAEGEPGFLAIGQQQVIRNLPGQPRAVHRLTTCDVEPGLGAGRLTLDDGSQLFVARGTSLRGQVPVDHLDLDVVPPGGQAMHLRLYAEAGLSLAARMAPLAQPIAAPAPAPVAAPAPVHPLVAAAPVSCRTDAQVLAPLAGNELWTAFATRQQSAWTELLTLLEGAQPDTALLAEAEERTRDRVAFAQAVAGWAP